MRAPDRTADRSFDSGTSQQYETSLRQHCDFCSLLYATRKQLSSYNINGCNVLVTRYWTATWANPSHLGPLWTKGSRPEGSYYGCCRLSLLLPQFTCCFQHILRRPLFSSTVADQMKCEQHILFVYKSSSTTGGKIQDSNMNGICSRSRDDQSCCSSVGIQLVKSETRNRNVIAGFSQENTHLVRLHNGTLCHMKMNLM